MNHLAVMSEKYNITEEIVLSITQPWLLAEDVINVSNRYDITTDVIKDIYKYAEENNLN